MIDSIEERKASSGFDDRIFGSNNVEHFDEEMETEQDSLPPNIYTDIERAWATQIVL